MAVSLPAEQLCLSGIELKPQATDRLVFMALPDESTAARVWQSAHLWKNKYRLHGEPFPKKRLHMSLCHIGDYFHFPQDIANRAVEAASHVALPPIDVHFDRIMSFSGRLSLAEREDSYAFALLAGDGTDELAVLREALVVEMLKAGLKPNRASHFKPHLTLLYDRRHRIEECVEPIRWMVCEFVLIRSLLGHGRYELLGRWPLTGRRPVQSAILAKGKTAIVG